MKVCILTSVHIVWDTRIYHREAQSLAQEGYRVTLIATGVDSEKTPFENIEIIGLKRPKHRLGRPLNWSHFLKAALKTKADIYHFHDPDLLFVGLLIKLLSKRPVIYDCHEPYREAINERDWIPKPIRSIVGWSYDYTERIISGFFSAVIVANPSQQSHFPTAKLIQNFPKLEAFDFHKQPCRDSRQIAHLGLSSKVRGITDLVEAGKLLSNRKIKFLLMGPFANESTRLMVEELKTDYKLEEAVECLGLVPYQQGIDLLTQSAIGVIPFRSTPALRLIIPTKLFEYLACGLPVVVSDLPGITPFVREADCGLVVPAENPQAFAEAIAYLLDHPEEAKRMGENGRRAVLEKYNWSGEAEKLLDLYRTLLNPAPERLRSTE